MTLYSLYISGSNMAFIREMLIGAGIAFTLGGLIAGTNILSTWVTGTPLTTIITDKTGLPTGGPF